MISHSKHTSNADRVISSSNHTISDADHVIPISNHTSDANHVIPISNYMTSSAERVIPNTYYLNILLIQLNAPPPFQHTKEHILCNADDHKMNRHHMALFVRNCRLILLLRRDYTEANLNTFQPAEWRWKLPQVS